APAQLASIFEHVKQQPDRPASSADPRSAVLVAFATLLDPQDRPAVFWDAQLEREFRGMAQGDAIQVMPRILGTRWLRDVLQSTTKIEIEGGAGLWRVNTEYEQSRVQLYVALDRGVAKLIGGTGLVSSVGRYVLRGDAKADARARKLLDWVQADADLAGALVSFKRIWGPGMPTSHDAILLAGAVLARSTDPDRVIPVASRCASTLPNAAIACHEALFFAYRARGRWAEAVEQSEAILAARPSDLPARAQIHAWALARAGRFDDAEHILDQVLAKNPDHLGARIGRFEVAAIRGATADMLQRADALTSSPTADVENLNYVAWYRLGQGGDLTAALELARRAVEKLPRSSGVVNTLAAIEAERGELDRAVHDNWKAMELSNAFEPLPADWYVEGRILEQLGLTADATAAYKRVPAPEYDQLLSTHALAQRRLAALGVAH
ncbi:MAG TPA: tetratricopeptide repeat protein, partial [Kofleriaceae bacterium]|nr:tetratricopeptide repeat protein [Kofleriaceae bacterium]